MKLDSTLSMTTQILQENIYTVSRLNNEARFILEDTFSMIWVEGEISNFAAPTSGHWYFSLKDSSAQIRCAMFRVRQRKLEFIPKDGMHILVKGRVSLYENRGEFQLIVDEMEERGEGKLRRAFEMLKKKLEAAGLFDAAHKKPIPLFPKQIGVITSQTGAAIRDILTVLKRRLPCVPVIIYPTLVQGESAASAIVKAIETANRRRECDTLILARGGGSLEDLWPFNEEIVALAIYQSDLPILSGIGHEVDFTIADFTADKRAPTPSAAAEMATPDQSDLLQLFTRYYQTLQRQVNNKLFAIKQELNWIQKHLFQQHPRRQLREKMQKLDYYELTFVQLQTKLISKLQTALTEIEIKFHRGSPSRHIHSLQHKLNIFKRQCLHLMGAKLLKQQTDLTHFAAKLDALSPLSTLKRGYAIVTDEDQRILTDPFHLKRGDKITIRLSNGLAKAAIEEIS